MREDEQVSDAGDDFEVYERKKPRPEIRPGSVPDTSQSGERQEAPEEPAETHDEWLAPPPPEPQPVRRSGLLGGLYGGPRDEDADFRSLPDPPAEPMRVQTHETHRARSPAPQDAAPTRTRSTPSRSSTPIFRGDTMRIAIAATEFNYDITHMMIERARAHAEFLGASITHIVRVPGVYDLPLAVKRLLGRDDVDAVATLGVVIEGETDHDDLVIQHAARKIIDLSLEHDKPVGLGITGPGMSRLQAEARIDRAKDAVEACVKLHRTLADY